MLDALADRERELLHDRVQRAALLLGDEVGGAGGGLLDALEAAFEALGLQWRYLTIEVHPESLTPAIVGAKAMGFRGIDGLAGEVHLPHFLDREHALQMRASTQRAAIDFGHTEGRIG